MGKTKRTEQEIAQKAVSEYGKSEVQSIHALDLIKYGLETESGTNKWQAGARVESGGDIHKDTVTGFCFYYRAMSTKEYYHLRKTGIMPQTNGHQGLAPNRSYSKGYMTKCYYFTHLVEFSFRSSFRETLYEQGWKEGSGESGCTAWGIGIQTQNSWKNSSEGGIKTKPKTKKKAKHPYDIYKDHVFQKKVTWRLVNVRYYEKDWVSEILKRIK